MKIVVTGAAGFLGWHTRCRLHAYTDHDVVPVGRGNGDSLPDLVEDADAILHLAGVNRASDAELSDGNIQLAHQLVSATKRCATPPMIIYANSIQAGNQTPYGDGKAAAAAILEDAALSRGSVFVDVRLPNLFGEHARPHYNMFTATFAEKRIRGEEPTIQDRQISLLHAQDAAQALIDGLGRQQSTLIEPPGHPTSVVDVWEKLGHFHDLYSMRGEMPAFVSKFDVDMFNTYRAALWPSGTPIRLDPKSDPRGRLVETIRAHGSEGQAFVSTTKAGVTRGNHYHLSKIERFVVLAGHARIALRKMFTPEVMEFYVSGDDPVAIDMPSMWTHNITNTGDGEVVTQFWTNELFDPARPDTFWVNVDSEEHAA